MTESASMIPPGFQAVDQTVVNSTVFVWSHYLTWPLNANADYAYESLILFSADAESGFRYRITVPDDVQVRLGAPDSDVQDTEDWFEILPQSSPHRARGIVRTGTHDGELRIEFAQRSAAAGATTLMLGSWIELQRLIGGAIQSGD